MKPKKHESTPGAFEIEFDPVPRRNRIDGWSPERQRNLVSAYAECGCITEACERVGMSRASYYTLERAPFSGDFRRAMAAAGDYSNRRLVESARSRGIHGVTIPHYYKGELVGTHQRFNDRLAMFMMQKRMPEQFGTPEERANATNLDELRALELEQLTRKIEKPVHDREIRDIPYAMEMQQDDDEALAMEVKDEFQRQKAIAKGKIWVPPVQKGRLPPDVMSSLSTSAAFQSLLAKPQSPLQPPSPSGPP